MFFFDRYLARSEYFICILKGRFTPVRIINSHQFKILTAVRIIYTCCACCNSQRVHICENYQIVRNILIKTRSRIGLKNHAFPLMSSEGRDRTKQIQKQEVLHPWSVQVVEFIGRIILKHGAFN